MDHALDPDLVDRLHGWLSKAECGTAWLTGCSGSGMTRMVTDLVSNMESVWVTSSGFKSRAFFRDVCHNPLAVNGRRKVLIMDELDALLGNETAMTDVAFVMKNNRCVPVVCILKNTRAAKGCDLAKKAALVLHFPAPTHDAMIQAVMATLPGAPKILVAELCAKTPGDIRHVLRTLEAGSNACRDIVFQTADSVAKVLGKTMPFAEALRIFSTDSGAVASGVFESYHHTTDDIDDTLGFADCASLGDLVNERMHARQQWDLMELFGCLSVVSASVLLPKADVSLEKYGVAWNKGHMQCTKAKAARNVAISQAEAGVSRLSPADLAYVRLMIRGSVHSKDSMRRVCDDAGLDAGAVLNVMRLWNGEYKLSTHARVKRWLTG
jgi:hypothetical protein